MRLIDADEIHYDKLLKTGYKEHPLEWAVSQSKIDNMPTIDAVPVKHGKWIEVEVIDDDVVSGVVDAAQCSECGYEERSGVYWANTYCHYCPYCGAKMDGGERR